MWQFQWFPQLYIDFFRAGIVSLTFVLLMFLFYSIFYFYFSRATVSAVLQPCRTCHMLFVLLARCVMCSWQINDDEPDSYWPCKLLPLSSDVQSVQCAVMVSSLSSRSMLSYPLLSSISLDLLLAVTASLSRLLLSLLVEQPAPRRRGLVTVWYGDTRQRPSPASDDVLFDPTGRQLFLSTFVNLGELFPPRSAFRDPPPFDCSGFWFRAFWDFWDDTFVTTLSHSSAELVGFFTPDGCDLSEHLRILVGVAVFEVAGNFSLEGSGEWLPCKEEFLRGLERHLRGYEDDRWGAGELLSPCWEEFEEDRTTGCTSLDLLALPQEVISGVFETFSDTGMFSTVATFCSSLYSLSSVRPSGTPSRSRSTLEFESDAASSSEDINAQPRRLAVSRLSSTSRSYNEWLLLAIELVSSLSWILTSSQFSWPRRTDSVSWSSCDSGTSTASGWPRSSSGGWLACWTDFTHAVIRPSSTGWAACLSRGLELFFLALVLGRRDLEALSPEDRRHGRDDVAVCSSSLFMTGFLATAAGPKLPTVLDPEAPSCSAVRNSAGPSTQSSALGADCLANLCNETPLVDWLENLSEQPVWVCETESVAAAKQMEDRGPSTQSSSSGCSGIVAGHRGDAETRGNLRRGDGSSLGSDATPVAGLIPMLGEFRSAMSRDTDVTVLRCTGDYKHHSRSSVTALVSK